MGEHHGNPLPVDTGNITLAQRYAVKGKHRQSNQSEPSRLARIVHRTKTDKDFRNWSIIWPLGVIVLTAILLLELWWATNR